MIFSYIATHKEINKAPLHMTHHSIGSLLAMGVAGRWSDEDDGR